MTLDEAIQHCEEKSCGNNACALEHKQLAEWLNELKELRSQNTWKPSEEQINALSITVKHGYTDDKEALGELLEQLKAL